MTMTLSYNPYQLPLPFTSQPCFLRAWEGRILGACSACSAGIRCARAPEC